MTVCSHQLKSPMFMQPVAILQRHHCLFCSPRCQEVEEAFCKISKGQKSALKDYNDYQVKQLTKLIEVTCTELSKEDRQKVMNMYVGSLQILCKLGCNCFWLFY